MTDPLAWLARTDLNCETLQEQIEARYAVFGAYEDLPSEKKDEYKKVHEIACGERFKDCALSTCEVLDPVFQTNREREAYLKRYRSTVDARANMIAEQKEREDKRHLSWERFTIPEDDINGPAEKPAAKKALPLPEPVPTPEPPEPTPPRHETKASSSSSTDNLVPTSPAGQIPAFPDLSRPPRK